MYEQIVKDTAQMVAMWQCYGFCHGVLNTDNMSILGLTLDYGPFMMMEHYDPDLICNHTDLSIGRYTFIRQPQMCKWNLKKLAQALHPFVNLENSLKVLKQNFDKEFEECYYERMGQKLGFLLTEAFTQEQTSGVRKQIINKTAHRDLTIKELECIKQLFDTMKETKADFTDTFRILAQVRTSSKCGCTNNLGEIASAIAKECAPIHIIEDRQN